jgi:hypothetical protein
VFKVALARKERGQGAACFDDENFLHGFETSWPVVMPADSTCVRNGDYQVILPSSKHQTTTKEFVT